MGCIVCASHGWTACVLLVILLFLSVWDCCVHASMFNPAYIRLPYTNKCYAKYDWNIAEGTSCRRVVETDGLCGGAYVRCIYKQGLCVRNTCNANEWACSIRPAGWLQAIVRNLQRRRVWSGWRHTLTRAPVITELRSHSLWHHSPHACANVACALATFNHTQLAAQLRSFIKSNLPCSLYVGRIKLLPHWTGKKPAETRREATVEGGFNFGSDGYLYILWVHTMVK